MSQQIFGNKPRSRLHQIRQPARELVNDCSGVAAVEFAVIASVLVLLLLGMSDVVPAFLVNSLVGTSAGAAADVTSEYSLMQASDMVNVFSAAADVLAPYSSATQAIRITNVYSDGNGNARVYWSCGNGTLAPYTARSPVSNTPTGSPISWFVWLNNTTGGGYTLNGTNTSYVLAEIAYTFTAPTQFVLRSPVAMSATAYYLPRVSTYIGFPWDGVSSDAPTAPASTTGTSSLTLSNGAVCNYAK